MSDLSRRDLLKVAGGLSASLGTASALDPETAAVDERLRSFFEQFHRAPAKEGLPTPDVVPALGLTDHGWFEYPEGADGWRAVPLGTADNPVEAGHFRSLAAERIDVAPVKVGLLADVHYPGDDLHLGASGISRTKEKLEEFVADMNDWGADHVFFLGDNTVEWGSRRKSRRKIAEFRRLVEENLEMPTHTVWGNHEYGNADTWGADWSYDPWDVGSHEETWYSVETRAATVVVLNNGFSESGHYDTGFPSEQVDWLRRKLRTTTGPIVVLSHLPLSIGTGQRYDHARNEERVGRLLSRYDNVVCTFFGHCHHDSSLSPGERNQPPYFDRMREQRAYGLRHVFVPWIHRLGWDTDVTPYGKLSLYPDGRARLEAPYSESDTREVFEVTGGTRTPRYAEDDFLRDPMGRLSWETHFDSLDGFRRETGGDGRATLHDRGARLSVDGDGSAALAKLREFADPSVPVTSGWTDCIWRCYARIGAVEDATVDLLWGNPASNHVGFRIDDGEVRGVREDGTEPAETHVVATVEDGDTALLQLYYSVELDRVNFIVGARGARPKAGLRPGSPDREGSGRVLHAGVESEGGSGSVDLGWVSVNKCRDMMIRG